MVLHVPRLVRWEDDPDGEHFAFREEPGITPRAVPEFDEGGVPVRQPAHGRRPHLHLPGGALGDALAQTGQLADRRMRAVGTDQVIRRGLEPLGPDRNATIERDLAHGRPGRNSAPARCACSRRSWSKRSRITMWANGRPESRTNRECPWRLTWRRLTESSTTESIGNGKSFSVRSGMPPPQAL
ncbi:hypothetical protein [Candidatus Amarobacter glycogenicus]|uniref:hypothetical protein n=1 Tax=Candidatus Amarobacter glycogenicus TaxID=3140699 RepID=UPI0031CC88A8